LGEGCRKRRQLDERGAETMVRPAVSQGPRAVMNPFTLITPAYAQDVSGMLGSATQFAPLVLIFAVFYFLLIRPQQQKQKEMRAMLQTLKRGDRVVTGGGILGTVQRVPMVQDKDGKQVASTEVEVEIAPNLRVTVLRDTITTVIKPVAANDTKPVKDKVS
jgi:preprotein translocase subunit YajC